MKNKLRTLDDISIFTICAFGSAFGFIVGIFKGMELQKVESIACIILAFILLYIGFNYDPRPFEVECELEDEEA